MKSKRISVRIEAEEAKVLQWIIDSTGSNMTDAVRTVLDMAMGNFTSEMIHHHYLLLRKRDREARSNIDSV